MKTRKNENCSKLREEPFAEEFSEMGLGCGLVGRCRARLLLSGTKVDLLEQKTAILNCIAATRGVYPP